MPAKQFHKTFINNPKSIPAAILSLVVHNGIMPSLQRILRLGSFTSTMRLLVTKQTLQPSIEIPKRIH